MPKYTFHGPVNKSKGTSILDVVDSFGIRRVLRVGGVVDLDTAGYNAISGEMSLVPYTAPNPIAYGKALWRPSGAKAETLDPNTANLTNQAALTSGILRLIPLRDLLLKGESYATANFVSATTALATATHQWACLVRREDRKIVAVSPNGTSGAWAANAAKPFTFNTPYVPGKDEEAWVGLMVAATTVPTLFAAAAANIALLPTIYSGQSNTGLTTPLALDTVVTAPTAATTALASIPYAYLT